MEMAKCRACGALIGFIKTPKGHRMPVDPEGYLADVEDPKRSIVLTDGTTQKGVKPEDRGYIPHWSTCSDPSRFRRDKAKH